MKRLGLSICLGLALAGGIVLATATASAGVIFNMTGTCESFCGSTGQNSGDPISGFVEFNNFDAVANGTFLVPDSYHLEFGTVILDSATLPPASDYYLRSGHDTLQKIDASDIGPGSFDVWSAVVNIPIIFLGNCFNCATNQWVFGFVPGSSGHYQFTRATALPAPEPASTVPFVAGLALLGGALLRRRASAQS